LSLGIAVLLESESLARKPKSGAEATPVYLRQRISEAPACTPLHFTKGGSKSPTMTLRHALGRLSVVTLSAKEYEEAGPTATFRDCLNAVADYEGRYTEEQIAAFETGRLTPAMPAEFAIMLLGSPATVDGVPQEAAFEALPPRSVLAWLPWRSIIQVDARRQIERIRTGGQDRAWIRVEWDAKKITFTSEPGAVVELSSQDKARADYDRATEAYKAGDHTGAFAALLLLAEAGHAPSQYAVGDMLYHGDAVTKDLGQAAKWIGQAAASYLPGALYQLGLMQLRGEGVAQDPIAAYASMALAGDLGYQDAGTVIKKLEGELDASQLAAAKEVAKTRGIRPPVLIHRKEPEYPEVLRVARLEGWVVVRAVIGTDGSVSNLEVLQIPRHGGSTLFGNAAVEAVSAWRYEPARRPDGEPVAVFFTVVIEFDLL
jgi:TonB family protein